MTYEDESPLSDATCAELLLEPCSPEWQSVVAVVARAMYLSIVRYDTQIGDLFLEQRLRRLAADGFIEFDNDEMPYGRYNVRLK